MTTGWSLSIKMMPFIRNAIGEMPAKYFFDIQTATFEQDTQKATDLILKLSGGDVAVRVRSFKYVYRDWGIIDDSPLAFDWSVRFVANGYKTEIHKLREGFARWYFIGLANKEETGLHDYGLIDLDKCRAINLFEEVNWQINPNGDGTVGGYMAMRKVEKMECIIWHPIYTAEKKQEEVW